MKYEYNAIQNSTFLRDKFLNHLGEEGWELITHAYNPDTCDHFYTFRREKVSPQDTPAYRIDEEKIERLMDMLHEIDKENPEIKEYRDKIERGNKQYFNSTVPLK